MRRISSVLIVSTLAMLGACKGSNGPGPAPASNPPQITCAAPVTVTDAVGSSQAVNFQAPTVTQGAPPVNTSCSPASGSTFPLGDTSVTCTATDAQARTATCSFTVSLRHRELSITKIVAFGDSITEGQNGRPGLVPFIDVPNAYPTVLQTFFVERIPTQQITVVNAGVGGEAVTDPRSNQRLKDAIAKHQPQVLLLLEGINDLHGGVGTNSIANAIRDHIRTARDRGVQYVIVSTVLPTTTEVCTFPNPSDPPCRGARTPAGQPEALNQQIRSLVPAGGAHLVDPYNEFQANRATYIDTDGLHLRPAGNRALATAFWNRILETVPAKQLFGY